MKKTSTHEWVSQPKNGIVKVGITLFAAKALEDIVYVQLLTVGTQVHANQEAGVVESTKSASDIYAPLAGTVVKINDDVVADPSKINADPEGDGWLYEIRLSQVSDYDNLPVNDEPENL